MQYDNFGQFLRQKRTAQAISLNKFAFDCGIEPATLSNFETSKSDILFNKKIAKGFNQTPAQLLTEFENEK